MSRAIKSMIEDAVQFKVLHLRPLAGGMISQVMQVELANGETLVAKVGDGSHDLTIEAYMLRYLQDVSELPVPAVLHAEPNLLLMEHIEGVSEWDKSSLRHLGELLASCHQIKGTAYGLERDTLIGPLHQPNPSTSSWIQFFRDNRLLYMLGIARDYRALPLELEHRLREITDKLKDYLIEPDNPVLIHGDMWRTNVIVSDGRIAGIIDPALYYAHNEMELAYMTLFDGIGQDFFDAYTEHISIDDEFYSVRRHIYNLYPLLVHYIIFGDKYLPHLDTTLKRFGI